MRFQAPSSNPRRGVCLPTTITGIRLSPVSALNSALSGSVFFNLYGTPRLSSRACALVQGSPHSVNEYSVTGFLHSQLGFIRLRIGFNNIATYFFLLQIFCLRRRQVAIMHLALSISPFIHLCISRDG